MKLTLSKVLFTVIGEGRVNLDDIVGASAAKQLFIDSPFLAILSDSFIISAFQTMATPLSDGAYKLRLRDAIIALYTGKVS